ncbi:hypothetical protein MCOR02_002215 [Pyricularia oryzae]|uniref:Uncharacterized protein n=1 Tax=Pyricularia oryzae TaxID=318829 RepID=A0A4P7N1F2_PYROR|nr:hypothetical protein MCOR02_002215 [Pyricularia oryzae]KAI6313908.1 hypothetical protein MCOR34_005106 [Pyricularia oryzae]KAI6317363.1 hypothetical protein MCOR29_006352 [Pyricularia oryzae]KAI6338206.1 hypothetical protein MCOR30_003131 [Pyricularia oryzae]KAI6415300.1 hypothetical protein MCOR20_001634 [Pyricularia oryzae]
MASCNVDPDGFGPESALAYCLDESLGEPLLTDHRFNPLNPSLFTDIVSQVPENIIDDGTLQQLPSAITDLTIEQWEVGKDEINFIKEASRSFSEEDVETPIKQAFLQSLPSRPPRLELPLLTLASQAESREMLNRLATVPPVSLVFDEIPMDDLGADKGEGLEFPPSAYTCQINMENELQEKLELTKEAVCYLAEIVRVDRSDLEASLDIKDMMPPARLNRHDLRLTPPATPRFSHMQSEPWVPGSDGVDIPSPSEPRSLLSDDLKAIEDHIFQTDNGPLSGGSPLANCSPVQGTLFTSTPEDEPAIPVRDHKKIDDFKLELPLVANTIDEPSGINLLIDGIEPFVIDQEIGDKDTASLTALLEIDASAQLREAADKVRKLSEQEQIEPLDGLARLKLPMIDTTPPEADWKDVVREEKQMLAYIMERHSDEFQLAKWKIDKRAERDLPWLMSSSTGIVLGDEGLEEVDESALHEFCAFDDDVLGISALSRKIKELALLRRADDLDDDDLEPAFARTPTPVPTPASALPTPENSEDLMTCIRKKRKALEALQSSPFTKRAKCRPPLNGEETLLIGDKSPEGAKLLASFLELNGHGKAPPRQSQYFRASAGDGASRDSCNSKQPANIPQEKPSDKTNAMLTTKNSQQFATNTPGDVPSNIAKPAPVPRIQLPDFPLKLVVSISLPRDLVRLLERLLPGVELIERDYNAYNYSTWAAGTSAPSTIISSLGEEADITLSPGVGVILTSTVHVRQGPFQGCDGDSILQRQVRKTCRRYKRLVVLVSDKSLDDTILPMAPADALAFAEFQAFARSLQDVAEVSVFWVGGGQTSLATWVASLATECASLEQAPFYRLLCQGESHWELFLRRAGMNTFAAQMVCGLLQSPYGTEAASFFGGSGLAAFVNMSANERAQRYTSVLGGRRVLDRVSDVVDQNWGRM